MRLFYYFPRQHLRFFFAILFSVIGALFCAIVPYVTQKALHFASVNQISFFRNSIVLLLTLVSILFTKKNQSVLSYLKTDKQKIHLIRAISGFVAVMLFLFSLKTISAAEANVLNNLSPMYLPFIAYIWKRSPIHYHGWPGVVIAFIGTALLMHPNTMGYNYGLFLALLSGIVLSITFMAQQLASYSEPFYRSLFYYACLSTLFTGVTLYWEGFPLDVFSCPNQVFSLLLLGVLAFISQLSIIAALQFAPAKFVTPFLYLSVLFSLGLDIFFGQKEILLLEILGILLILGGLYLHFFLSFQKEKKLTDLSNNPT